MDQIISYFIEMDLLKAVYYYILIIAGIISLINRPSNRVILILQIYLILTLLIEISANYVRHLGEYNIWIYNIWVLIQFPLFTKILFGQFQEKYIKIEYILLIFFIVFPLFNFFFWQGINTLNTITLQIGAVTMVVLVLVYLKSLLDIPEKSLVDNPQFYIALGILIFYVGTILLYSFFIHLSEGDIVTLKQSLIILTIINCVTYSLFILAILFDRKSNRRKKMSRVF